MNKWHNIIAIALSALLTVPLPVAAKDSYQQRVLFSPGAEILQAEARGRVMIYDGLTSETVDKALDQQFERIENMMFVGTIEVQEDGDYEVEDGCD